MITNYDNMTIRLTNHNKITNYNPTRQRASEPLRARAREGILTHSKSEIKAGLSRVFGSLLNLDHTTRAWSVPSDFCSGDINLLEITNLVLKT